MKLGWLKKHATAVVLSVLAVGAVTYVLVIDQGSLSTGETDRRKTNLLPAWRSQDVSRVVVERPQKSFTLESNGGVGADRTWDLVMGDTREPADEQAVDRYLSTLEYAVFTRAVPSGSVDREAFGLASPRVKVRVAMGELTFDVALGGPAETSETVYAEVQGRGVYVVAAALGTALDIDGDQLRARDIVPYFSTELKALSLVGEGGTRKLERGTWSGGRGSGFRFAEGSDGPVGRRVDGGRLDQILVAFGKMQADGFLDPATAVGASDTRLTITLVPHERPPGVLLIGAQCPGRPGLTAVLRTAPTKLAVCVPEAVLAPLFLPAAELVDDGLVGASVDEITEVRVESGGKVFDMARSAGGFKVRSPEDRTVPGEVGNAFLHGIVDARGKLAPEGTTPPSGDLVRVRVFSQGGLTPEGVAAERTEEIELGAAGPDGRVARRVEDGALLTIGAGAAVAFTSADLLLRDRKLLAIPPASIDLLAITEGSREQRLKREGSDFVLVSPTGKGLAADQAWTTEVLDAMSSLEAQRFVAEVPDPSFGLERGRLRIAIGLEPEKEGAERRTIALTLGERTDDGPYATLDGTNGVFIAPMRMERVASRWLISRAAFAVDPSAAERIELEGGGKRVVLKRDGAGLAIDGAAAGVLSTSILDALGELDAIEAVTVGAATPAEGLDKPSLTMTVARRKRPDDASAPPPVRFVFGASDTRRGASICHARRDDVDATYTVPESAVRSLRAAIGADSGP